MKKATMKNTKTGDTVKNITVLACKYYNYPEGKNLVTFPPETLFRVVSIPAKCRKHKGPGHDNLNYFLNLEPENWPEKTTGAATNFCNVKKGD